MLEQPTAAARPLPRPAEGFDGVPRIRLGDGEWPIPLLAPRQNRIIEPRIMPLLQELQPSYEKMKRLADEGKLTFTDFRMLTEAQYDSALDIVAAALTKAHPSFRREDLLDLPGVTSAQLMNALPVIMKQTGLYVAPGTPGAEGAKAGE